MTLIEDLQGLLGADAVLHDKRELAGFVQDWRGRYGGSAACVVLPSSTDQVSAVLRDVESTWNLINLNAIR